MKRTLIIVYVLLFAAAWFGLATVGASSISAPTSTSIVSNSVKPLVAPIPVISEKVIWTDYNLIANKIFNKFIAKYPAFTQQVSCETMDTYINKVIQKTKIKFRRPDVNKENIVKHNFENLLSDYLNNALECDDFVDVDRDETDIGTEDYVKCLFDGWNNQQIQSCYSSDGMWSCSWIGTCTIKVSGNIWENISWKSSCGWYAYTIVDWESDYAKFYCGQETIQPVPVCGVNSRDVKCISPIYSWKIDVIRQIINTKLQANPKKK